MKKNLHIITLNIPCPPDYGGMIDSYFRIKALSSIGISIHLHCFEYGRSHSEELEKYCKSVRYYPRETDYIKAFSGKPYIINSRRSDNLFRNLLNDDSPILFDGLHTTLYLGNTSLVRRKKFVRAHNIEHQYYRNLSRLEKNPAKKIYFKIEELKLHSYEPVIKKADKIFAISRSDNEYFRNVYNNSELIPPFHPYDHVISEPGYGRYLLYHGDLSVNENSAIANFLINEVFSKVPNQCIIAGKNPSRQMIVNSSLFKNIRLIPDPDNETLSELIKNAHINILPAILSNGFRIKLLSALFNGRHCLVNKQILYGTELDDQCVIAASGEEFIEKINLLMAQSFTEGMKLEREKVILQQFNNVRNAEKMAAIIFNE